MAPQSVEWLKGPILMLGSLMAQIKTDPGREMHQQQVAATAVDEALQMLCALAGPSKDPLLGLIHTGLCGQHLQREPLGTSTASQANDISLHYPVRVPVVDTRLNITPPGRANTARPQPGEIAAAFPGGGGLPEGKELDALRSDAGDPPCEPDSRPGPLAGWPAGGPASQPDRADVKSSLGGTAAAPSLSEKVKRPAAAQGGASRRKRRELPLMGGDSIATVAHDILTGRMNNPYPTRPFQCKARAQLQLFFESPPQRRGPEGDRWRNSGGHTGSRIYWISETDGVRKRYGQMDRSRNTRAKKAKLAIFQYSLVRRDPNSPHNVRDDYSAYLYAIKPCAPEEVETFDPPATFLRCIDFADAGEVAMAELTNETPRQRQLHHKDTSVKNLARLAAVQLSVVVRDPPNLQGSSAEEIQPEEPPDVEPEEPPDVEEAGQSPDVKEDAPALCPTVPSSGSADAVFQIKTHPPAPLRRELRRLVPPNLHEEDAPALRPTVHSSGCADAVCQMRTHPPAPMWRELRRLVQIGERLERVDMLPPRPPHSQDIATSLRDDLPPAPEHGWPGLTIRQAELALLAGVWMRHHGMTCGETLEAHAQPNPQPNACLAASSAEVARLTAEPAAADAPKALGGSCGNRSQTALQERWNALSKCAPESAKSEVRKRKAPPPPAGRGCSKCAGLGHFEKTCGRHRRVSQSATPGESNPLGAAVASAASAAGAGAVVPQSPPHYDPSVRAPETLPGATVEQAIAALKCAEGSFATQRHRDTETQRHRDTEIQRHHSVTGALGVLI